MKHWNWLLIAWWLIPILGWTSIILILTGSGLGWYFLIITAVWIFICLLWSFGSTRADEDKIYQDALINKEMIKKTLEEDRDV